MPVGGGDVWAAVWSRLHSRRECRQRACHPQRRGRHRVRLQPGRALKHDVPARALSVKQHRGVGAVLRLEIDMTWFNLGKVPS